MRGRDADRGSAVVGQIGLAGGAALTQFLDIGGTERRRDTTAEDRAVDRDGVSASAITVGNGNCHDRARSSLDRHATYIVAANAAGSCRAELPTARLFR